LWSWKFQHPKLNFSFSPGRDSGGTSENLEHSIYRLGHSQAVLAEYLHIAFDMLKTIRKKLCEKDAPYLFLII
jgi:hypothetical protein